MTRKIIVNCAGNKYYAYAQGKTYMTFGHATASQARKNVKHFLARKVEHETVEDEEDDPGGPGMTNRVNPV